MGAQLAKAAGQAHWAVQLDPTARLLLVHMALTALDNSTGTQPARLYFGGRADLVMALTGQDLDELDEVTARRACDRVKKAIRRLVDAGAISRARIAAAGARTEYAILVDQFDP